MTDPTKPRRINLRRNIVRMSQAKRKLTPEKVAEYKRWRVANPAGNQAEYARTLGVNGSTLKAIDEGHLWRGVRP